jgi:hypothetical protein
MEMKQDRAREGIACLEKAKLLAGLDDLSDDFRAAFSERSSEVDDRESDREVFQ